MYRALKWIFAAALLSAPTVAAFSQAAVQTFIDNFSYRELNPGVDGSPNPIGTGANRYLYHWHPSVGFNESQIKEGAYRGSNAPLTSGGVVSEFMNWRVIYPNGYDASGNTKYPMIIMLHGAGEGGRLWSGAFNFTPNDVDYDNNGKNIYWGGQPHLDAVNTAPPNPRAFPGIVIWPQVSSNGAWESGWANGAQNQNSIMVTRILEHFIANKGADPDRIYMHGLSNGAVGTWDLAAKRPDLFAAILPMSGTPRDVDAQVDILLTTPVWLSQGGQDSNPVPQAAITTINNMQAKGAVPRYSFYPNVGHDTWNYTYADPEFFSWMLSKTKKDIFVFGGDPSICTGGTLRLGFSAGMNSYQWFKDGVSLGSAGGAQTRYLSVTVPGTYTCQFVRRTNGATVLSNPLVVSSKGSSTLSPAVTSTGSLFETINQSGASNPITLSAPLGFSSYSWSRNGVAIGGYQNVTGNSYPLSGGGTGVAGDAGSYTVRVLEQSGCQSLASAPVVVTFFSSQPTASPPAAPTFAAITPTSVNVSWADYGSEVSYELWRFRFSNSGPPAYNFQSWTLVKSLPANTTTTIDNTLRPGGLYRYAIRAILSDNHGIFSPESQNYAPPVDNIPPTAPTNLLASNIKDSQVTLTWSPSSDNDRVAFYQIYNGSTLVATVNGSNEATVAPLTTTIVTGLSPGSTYTFSVRAGDYGNSTPNYSPFADPVTITTLASLPGLIFKYYTFAGNMIGNDGAYMAEPANNSFDFTQVPTQTGSVANFDISGANTFQNTGDPNNFVYSFDGYIEIPDNGNYQFYTASDDGSRLYINGTLLVQNDHLQGTTERGNNSPNGNDIALTAGRVPIRVTFFEQGGGNELFVRWQKTDAPNAFAKTAIPSSVLFQSSITTKSFYLTTTATDPSLLASWTTSANGTGGTAPSNFTTAQQIFVLANQPTVTIANPWTISGAGAKLVAGDGTNPIAVSVTGAYTGTMDAKANATITVTNATVPAFGSLDATSTVNFNVAGASPLSVPNATYGNVNFQVARPYLFPINATTVQGNLIVADGASTQGTTTNVSTIRVGGDLTFNNASGNPIPVTANQQYALNFLGGKTHTVSFGTGVNPTFFSLQTDPNDNVVFNNAGTHTYTFGSTTGGGLILKTGSTLNLGTGSLVIGGLGTINPNAETGRIAMNGGNITFASTATQNSNFSLDPTLNKVTNLSVTAPTTSTFNILSVMNVSGTVTLGGGLVNPGTGAFMTLLSDSTGVNARIAAIPTNARITGSITAQRFMPKKVNKVYRYISSPVKLSTAAQLQQAFPITGTFSGASTIPGVTSKASMFWYNQSQAYIAWPATTNQDSLKTGLGYTAYMRKTSGGVKWTVQGVPNQGTISFSGRNLMSTNGWSLLGNPYPSQIAWTGANSGGWTVANINATVYVRDNINDTQFNWKVYRPGITTFGANESILPGGIISAGQGFWVQSTGVPTLTISEAAKTASAPSSFYRTSESSEEPRYDVMSITLSDGTLKDGAWIAHDATVSDVYEPAQDAIKQANTTFNISTLSSDNVDLVINMTPSDFCVKNVKLNITRAAAGNYSLTFDGLNQYQRPVNATLTDTYAGKTVVISSGSKYDFSITSDVASSGADRFVITEKPGANPTTTLLATSACESSPFISIPKSQQGVSYQAFFNGTPVSGVVTSAGDSMVLMLNKKDLGYGQRNVTVMGSVGGCDAVPLAQSVLISLDTLPVPNVVYKSGKLSAIPGTADHFQWIQDGKVMKGKNDATLFETNSGSYQVEVTVGTCKKTSEIYLITGFEKPAASELTVFPNPFISKITVSLPDPVYSGTAVLYNTLGVKVQSASFITNDSQNAELSFPNLEPGAYILGVGTHRIKVIKVNP